MCRRLLLFLALKTALRDAVLCNLKFLCGAKPLASIKRESDGGGEGEATLMPTCRRKAADNFELLDLICKSQNPLKFSILVISFKRSGRRQPPGRLHPLPDLRLRGWRRKFTCRPTAPYWPIAKPKQTKKSEESKEVTQRREQGSQENWSRKTGVWLLGGHNASTHYYLAANQQIVWHTRKRRRF